MATRLLVVFALLATLLLGGDRDALAQYSSSRPLRIYAITFRGMTDVERGFQDYFAARRIPVQITWRDLNRDAARMPVFLDEIRRTRPDLVYTWGTSVTLGVVGPFDNPEPQSHIADIPVVFTLVAAPVLAKIVPDLKSSRRNVTGVFHVAPTEAQIRAMASYRPFKSIGILYTPTEQNSVVVVNEVREVAKRLGFTVVARPFRMVGNQVTAEGAPEMIREMKEQKVDWLYLPPDSYLGTQTQKIIIPAAMAVGLPTFASTEQLMETGALTGLICHYYAIGQFTAYKAEQILVNKVPPSRIPIETLTRFTLQVRMDVAEQLRMPPPLPMFNYAELIVPKDVVATEK
ncbi:MAG TPA: ABC transporter substrate-binding protein [Usitatibacter sp.]|jgi:putative ABC transport system substrate-binding protein|nr:ABC transporter substrate-binding protein [Usitatibacter sp.]